MEWNRRIRFVLFSYTGTDIVSLLGKKKKRKIVAQAEEDLYGE